MRQISREDVRDFSVTRGEDSMATPESRARARKSFASRKKDKNAIFFFLFLFGRFSSRNQRVSVPERIDIGRPEHRVERRVITIAVATLVAAARFAHSPLVDYRMARDGEEAITTSKRDRRGRSGWRRGENYAGQGRKNERGCAHHLHRGERDPAFALPTPVRGNVAGPRRRTDPGERSVSRGQENQGSISDTQLGRPAKNSASFPNRDDERSLPNPRRVSLRRSRLKSTTTHSFSLLVHI